MSLLGAIFGSPREYSRLRERIEELETELHSIRQEWDDFYDKACKTLRRIGRERQALDTIQAPTQEEPVEPLVAGNGGGSTHGFLTERQRIIQQQILKRRAHLT